jgi:serine/threonine-protein kinase
MGVVVKCVHIQLEKYVAIKMLRQDVLLDHDAKQRFIREAQAAGKLRSEHVAKVEDVGHFPETGVPYMVMEFLDGHDLGDLVDERGAIAAPFATMLMLQAAEALAEAHSQGIVHRDVKPSNLFVTWRPDGSAIVKVLDFGISKSASGTDMRLTQTQSLLGTPAYMSPEQMRSARLVDARTDIWSFGTVFYELLEGRRPFEAESFSEMCVKVAVDPPAPFVNTPPALQPIIARCLAKSPEQRYANMAELGRDLMPHVQDVHQASLLVERMVRVLGRASAAAAAGEQWDGPSTGVTRTPIPVTDAGSAPVVAWQHESGVVATPSPFTKADRTPDPTWLFRRICPRRRAGSPAQRSRCSTPVSAQQVAVDLPGCVPRDRNRDRARVRSPRR